MKRLLAGALLVGLLSGCADTGYACEPSCPDARRSAGAQRRTGNGRRLCAAACNQLDRRAISNHT